MKRSLNAFKTLTLCLATSLVALSLTAVADEARSKAKCSGDRCTVEGSVPMAIVSGKDFDGKVQAGSKSISYLYEHNANWTWTCGKRARDLIFMRLKDRFTDASARSRVLKKF